MKRQYLVIESIRRLKNDVYYMTFTGDCHEVSAPGQFINIKVEIGRAHV